MDKQKICLEGNTFVLEDENKTIIYAPQKGIMLKTEKNPLKNIVLYEELKEKGFFTDIPENIKIDNSWNGFSSLSLLLTRNCNLPCVYCYASAKKDNRLFFKTITQRDIS